MLVRPRVPALVLSQLLAESPQDLSAVGRAQRFQADRDSIPVDVEIPRGLKDLLDQLAAFLFGAAIVGTDRIKQRGLDAIGDDLYCVAEDLSLCLETEP